MIRRLPYALRYLIAFTIWLCMAVGLAVFWLGMMVLMPVIMLYSITQMKPQPGAQLRASIADAFVYKWPPFPRADWRRLLSLRRSAAQSSKDAAHSIEHFPRRRT